MGKLEFINNGVLDTEEEEILILNKNFEIKFYNYQSYINTYKNTGLKIKIGANFKNFISENASKSFYDAFNKAINNEPCETLLNLKLDDNLIKVKSSYRPVTNENNTVTDVLIITKQFYSKNNEKNNIKNNLYDINKSQSILQSLLDSTLNKIILLDTNYQVIGINLKMIEYLAQSYGKTINIGDDFRSIVKPEDLQLFLNSFESAKNGKSIVVQQETKNTNSSFWCEYYVVPIYSDDKQIIGVSITVKDISDQKQNNLVSEKSELRLKILFEQASSPMLLLNAETNIVLVNKEAVNLLGYEKEELYKLKIKDIANISASNSVIELYPHLNDYEDDRETSTFIKKDGSILVAETKMNLFELDDQPYAILSIQDVTERTISEHKLRKINHEIQLQNKINDIILTHTNNEEIYQKVCETIAKYGNYVLVWLSDNPLNSNPGKNVKVIYSYGLTEYTSGLNISLANNELSKGPTASVLLKGKTVITNNIEANSDFEPWLIRARQYGIKASICLPITVKNKITGTLNIYSNKINHFDADEVSILERISHNLALATNFNLINKERVQSETNLKSVVENTNIGHLLLDENYRIIQFNKIFNKVYRSLMNKDLVYMESFIHQAFNNQNGGFEKILNHVQKTLKTFEYDLNIPNSENIVVHMSITPVMRGGDLIGYSISAADITEHKELLNERQKMINELTQRNRDLEQFSYIVSHNIRSPLSTIIGFSNLIRMEMSENEKEIVYQGIESSAIKLDNIIKDLNEILSIKNTLHEQKTNVNLNIVIESILSSIEGLIKSSNALIKYDFSKIATIKSLKPFIHSILLNLITNALKYSKSTEQPIIHITSEKKDDTIILFVKDNGIGIDLKNYSDQLFGLYKRFNLEKEGKGMGLFMVKTQVNSLNGEIEVESELNKGTCFKITLPIN